MTLNKKRLLLIDGMNFSWRANVWRPGQTDTVEFLFLRNLRALIETHDPDMASFVLEGYPQARHDIDVGYKANRAIDVTNPEHNKRSTFLQEIREVRKLISTKLPFQFVRHPNWECDDTIYNLAKNAQARNEEVIVTSSDNDFIQLIQEFPEVKLHNATKKAFAQVPDYDYLIWKALRGDGSDNVKGIKGCGDRKAAKLANNDTALLEYLQVDNRLAIFEQNMNVLRFHTFDFIDYDLVETSYGEFDPDFFKQYFEEKGYHSMLTPTYWPRFVKTFEKLQAQLHM
jgi:5'-3' exonuclease